MKHCLIPGRLTQVPQKHRKLDSVSLEISAMFHRFLTKELRIHQLRWSGSQRLAFVRDSPSPTPEIPNIPLTGLPVERGLEGLRY